MEQQVQHLSGTVAVIRETLYGSASSPTRPASPAVGGTRSQPASPSPTRADGGALLASHGATSASLALLRSFSCCSIARAGNIALYQHGEFDCPTMHNSGFFWLQHLN